MVYEWVITIPSISFSKLRRISRQCVKFFVRYLKEEDANKKETTIAFIHFLKTTTVYDTSCVPSLVGTCNF